MRLSVLRDHPRLGKIVLERFDAPHLYRVGIVRGSVLLQFGTAAWEPGGWRVTLSKYLNVGERTYGPMTNLEEVVEIAWTNYRTIAERRFGERRLGVA